MYPFPAPLGLQPDDAPPPGNSSFAPTFPCQYASPAQRVQQKTLLQSHENAYPIPICNEIPSAEQHTAIANLQQLPDATIFACLKEFRSFNPGEQWFHLTCLSHQQRQAISALKDCSDDLVFLWLYSARSHGQYPRTV